MNVEKSVGADAIQAPVAKASAAIAGGVGSSAFALATEATHFWPVNFQQWAAAIASTVAACYSTFLLGEWLWKRAVKPVLRRFKWA
jgi:hypothetical protein